MVLKNDADAFGQLIEKRLVSRVEPIERRKFHDRLYFSLEQNRQDHDVHRT